MKKEIVQVYDNIVMPSGCVYKIRQAAAGEKNPTYPITMRLRTTLTACAVLLTALLAISPQVRAAVSDWVVKYIYPESGITIYEETNENGEPVRIMAVDTENPAFAQVRDGRLIFTGNGQNADITDQITPESPYIYTYMDEYGLTHYMVVGYSDHIENFGIYEFLREEQEGQQSWEGWANGYGRNFLDPETETRYPWVDIVWEQLGLPWPLPGE